VAGRPCTKCAKLVVALVNNKQRQPTVKPPHQRSVCPAPSASPTHHPETSQTPHHAHPCMISFCFPFPFPVKAWHLSRRSTRDPKAGALSMAVPTDRRIRPLGFPHSLYQAAHPPGKDIIVRLRRVAMRSTQRKVFPSLVAVQFILYGGGAQRQYNISWDGIRKGRERERRVLFLFAALRVVCFGLSTVRVPPSLIRSSLHHEANSLSNLILQNFFTRILVDRDSPNLPRPFVANIITTKAQA
jgi:hypothetical protein